MAIHPCAWTTATINEMLQMAAGLITERDLTQGVFAGSTEYTSGTEASSRSGAEITRQTSLTNTTESTIDVDGSIVKLYNSTLLTSTIEELVGSDEWEVDAVVKCILNLEFTRE